MLLWEKLALVVIPLIVIVVEPVLVSVTVFEALGEFTVWLAKVKLVGEKASAVVGADGVGGAELAVAAPVPVRDTVWAPLRALSVIDKLPVLVPLAAGLKVTEIAHCASAASDVPQLLLCEKLPLTAMLPMLMDVLPVLASVTV